MAGSCNSGNLRFGKNVRVPFFKFQPTNGFWKCPPLGASNSRKKRVWKTEQLPKSKSPLSAIHKIIWHILKDGSRKVNNGEPDLRFFHGNFWPVISHAVRKPCFSTSTPRGQNLPSRARNTKWHFWASPTWQGSKRKAKGRQVKRNTKWHLCASKVPAFGGRFRGPA